MQVGIDAPEYDRPPRRGVVLVSSRPIPVPIPFPPSYAREAKAEYRPVYHARGPHLSPEALGPPIQSDHPARRPPLEISPRGRLATEREEERVLVRPVRIQPLLVRPPVPASPPGVSASTTTAPNGGGRTFVRPPGVRDIAHLERDPPATRIDVVVGMILGGGRHDETLVSALDDAYPHSVLAGFATRTEEAVGIPQNAVDEGTARGEEAQREARFEERHAGGGGH